MSVSQLLPATALQFFGLKTLDLPLMTPFVLYSHVTCRPGDPHWSMPLTCGLDDCRDGPDRFSASALVPLCSVLSTAEDAIKARQVTSLCPGPFVAARAKVLAMTPASQFIGPLHCQPDWPGHGRMSPLGSTPSTHALLPPPRRNLL